MEANSKPKAIILTDGLLHTSDAKTAHGLIRGTDRFEIVAVIDGIHHGKDAGVIVDGINRHIPIFADLKEAMEKIANIQYCVIGVATVGGIMPEHFIPIIESCIVNKINIVNGLHHLLQQIPQLVALAHQHHVDLIDVRKPKDKKDLHFWNADIYQVKAPIIAVMGTDCALGKRTTARLIKEACLENNIQAQMIYTGQTGWMQGGKYGFIFDSTLNDFISGELEHAIITCYRETNPDIILLEGQASLRNPSGPCGSEFLISGNAKHVILVHAPKRKHYDHIHEWGEIPPLKDEIELIRLYGSKVIAVALNTEDCTNDEALAFQTSFEKELSLPVLLPLQQGVSKIIPFIQTLIRTEQ
jgi:uncharacterized NAD-dependent epimerase/dehydratase family protein